MASPARPIRVLHVDDDPDILDLTAEYLDRVAGRFTVDHATSAAAGRQILEAAAIDCVIADYAMPDRTGLEFLADVRESRPDLPFILFTSEASEVTASEAIAAGVTDYLRKRPDREGFTLLAHRIRQAVEPANADGSVGSTRRRFQTLVEEATDVILILAPDGTIRYATPSADRVLGRPPDALEGDSAVAAVHDADRPAVETGVETLVSAPTGRRTMEFRYRRPDGEVRWLEGRGRNLLDDPAIEGLVVYARDVTDRKEHELELERVRGFFTEAERLGDLGAWEFDGDGNVTWTDGTRRIHAVDDGYEPSMAAGLDFFHPDDRDRIRMAVDAALEGGDGYDIEARLTTAAGEERWVRTRGTPFDDGTVRGFIQDITDRKAREEALREANTQLEAAVEAGAVGTWQWHIPDDHLVVDPAFARRFGVDPEQARAGVPLERFTSSIHPSDRERVEAEIAAAVEDCGPYHAEYRVHSADDEVRWVAARGEVRCDDTGDPMTFPGALVDITERKRAERELERQNDRLDEFASLVSHDLRNPLSVAEGRLTLAREERDGPHLEAVARAHERMAGLIDDLLAMARESDARATAEPVFLARVVAGCWDAVATADATIECDIDVQIGADERRLRQLFENLFRNAVEHGGDGVTVTVGRLADGFYVADDGPGIPADERDAVFESGYSTRRGGTGYGLSIVEQVVDAHGWAIAVGESADGGARFEVTGVARVE